MERFRNEIIPSIFQSENLVHFTGACRDENDGARGCQTKLPAPVIAVIGGKIDIQQNQVRIEGFGLFQNSVEIFGGFHFIMIFTECFRQHLSNFQIIFHDKYSLRQHNDPPFLFLSILTKEPA